MMYLPLPDLLDNGVSYTRQDIKHTPFIYTRYTLPLYIQGIHCLYIYTRYTLPLYIQGIHSLYIY